MAQSPVVLFINACHWLCCNFLSAIACHWLVSSVGKCWPASPLPHSRVESSMLMEKKERSREVFPQYEPWEEGLFKKKTLKRWLKGWILELRVSRGRDWEGSDILVSNQVCCLSSTQLVRTMRLFLRLLFSQCSKTLWVDKSDSPVFECWVILGGALPDLHSGKCAEGGQNGKRHWEVIFYVLVLSI